MRRRYAMEKVCLHEIWQWALMEHDYDPAVISHY